MTSQDVVDQATLLLVDGRDSPTLPRLAGVTRREAAIDVPDLLPVVLDELGVPIPSRETYEVKVEAARELAAMLLDGELSPSATAAGIYRLFLPDYPDLAHPFFMLHEEYSLIGEYTTRSEAEVNEAVRAAARALLSQ